MYDAQNKQIIGHHTPEFQGVRVLFLLFVFLLFDGFCRFSQQVHLLFVCRQVMFGVNKVPDQRQVNGKMVLKQIEDALPLMQATRKKDDADPYVMPEKGKSALSYSFPLPFPIRKKAFRKRS